MSNLHTSGDWIVVPADAKIGETRIRISSIAAAQVDESGELIIFVGGSYPMISLGSRHIEAFGNAMGWTGWHPALVSREADK